MSERREQIEGRGFAGLALLGSSISPEPQIPATPTIPPKRRSEPVARFSDPAPRAIDEVPAPRAIDGMSAPRAARQGLGGVRLLWFGLCIVVPAIYQMVKNSEPDYRQNDKSTFEEVYPAYKPVIGGDPDGPKTKDELKPPVSTLGGRVYIQSEILYCLAENFRLATLDGAINRRSPREVRLLNDRHADFDRRCLNYRYMQQDLDTAKNEVDHNAFVLRGQALLDLANWR